MTIKWILVACLPIVSFLFTACSSNSASPVAPPAKAVQATAQPDFNNTFAEPNQLYDQLKADTPIDVAPANGSAQTVVLTMPTLFWINCEARVVSNLKQMPGIVRRNAASEQTELTVTFNSNKTTVEAIVAQLKDWDEKVTGWKVVE